MLPEDSRPGSVDELLAALDTAVGGTTAGFLDLDRQMGERLPVVIGAVVAFVWAFGVAFLFFKLIDKLIGMRTSPETELAGLDVPEIGTPGYALDQPAMEYSMATVISQEEA